jgi:iron complex transport system ATP-binding protein
MLRVSGVTAGYGRAPVLLDATVSVGPGEIVGLVGPNGSGKTTLIRVASRALRPSAGQVMVAGRDPYSLPAREAARLVAVVPQEVQTVFSFSVLEMVLMGRSPYRRRWGGDGASDWAQARDAMEAANVLHLADRTIEELSGGERQRVLLAQALAQDAPLLLLDEPTTHLDIRHVVDLLGIVRGLAAREGTAVLAIFHDLNLAAATCDRLYVLLGGRVVAEGEPHEVITSELLSSVYGVEADVHPSAVTGKPTVTIGPPPPAPMPGEAVSRPRIHVIGGAGRGAPLMRAFAERGFDVSAGVLHGSDSDALAAERLNLIRVTVPPFSDIDAESARECELIMVSAAVVVVCDAPFGPGNVANLRIALHARESGIRMVLFEQVPIADRDFTGGEATRLWGELRTRAEVVRSYEEAVSAVGVPAR